MAAIVVITYNSARVIDRCLDSCERVAGARVVVVDNASPDGTAKRVMSRTGVRLIANESNRGFAGAANQGIAAVDDDCVLLLNPDAEIETGVEDLERALSGSRVGAAGGLLIDRGGRPQTGFFVRRLPTAAALVMEVLGLNRLWPGNPANRSYRCSPPLDRETEVEQPAGAFLMVRREAWCAIGGFDEAFYPVWFEDVDFCKRLRDNGFRVLFVPSAVARHEGGHSAGALAWNERQVFWYGSLLRFAEKHLTVAGRRCVAFSTVVGCFPRALWRTMLERNGKPLTAYSKVVGLALLSAWRVNARDSRGGRT